MNLILFTEKTFINSLELEEIIALNKKIKIYKKLFYSFDKTFNVLNLSKNNYDFIFIFLNDLTRKAKITNSNYLTLKNKKHTKFIEIYYFNSKYNSKTSDLLIKGFENNSFFILKKLLLLIKDRKL